MRYKLLALACIFSANAMQLDPIRISEERLDPSEHFLKKMTQLDSNPCATAWNIQTQNHQNIRIYTAQTTRIILNFLVSVIAKKRSNNSEALYISFVQKYIEQLVASDTWLNDDEQPDIVSIGNIPQVHINYDKYFVSTTSTCAQEQCNRLDQLFELLQTYEHQMQQKSAQYGSIIAILVSPTIDS